MPDSPLFVDPFDPSGPTPEVRRAISEWQQSLPVPREGKMFGVLLAQTSGGTPVILRAFSGMLDGCWQVSGMVPPLFDVTRRSRDEGHYAGLVQQLTRLIERSESDRTVSLLRRLRRLGSGAIMKHIHDSYLVPNALGERRPLRNLFAPGEPPAGAGDCCAPKLLAEAFRQGLQPLALGEFYWGEGTATSGRKHGATSLPCRHKCGPLLTFMLQGLQLAPVEAAPAGLRIVLEDDWVVVIDKPSGLLSVPGKTVSDSVLTRLQARWPSAMLAHRLDQDTSGLLVAGKDMASYVALQKQFLRREIHKRYVAWLDGEVAASEGTIDLSLRVDVDDRPRQIHDPEHGKQAITEWRVLAREAGRTRVSFKPLTGRTHQLRVHAAHRMGLGIPIVGDRLYGRPDVRLFLHAEELSFIHPHHGREVYITAPPPW